MPKLSCESCQFGKYHKTFSSMVVNYYSSPFGVVHTDIWGPTRVKSVFDFSYFVTFIDDYSRMTWLFLMKDRSEILLFFKDFIKRIVYNLIVHLRF